MYLFVYGTLMQKHRNHKWLMDARYVGPCCLMGYQLYIPPHKCFPYIFPEKDRKVWGELYEITDEEHLRVLDQREVGYNRLIVDCTKENAIYAYVGKPELKRGCMVFEYDRWVQP